MCGLGPDQTRPRFCAKEGGSSILPGGSLPSHLLLNSCPPPLPSLKSSRERKRERPPPPPHPPPPAAAAAPPIAWTWLATKNQARLNNADQPAILRRLARPTQRIQAFNQPTCLPYLTTHFLISQSVSPSSSSSSWEPRDIFSSPTLV